MREAVDVLKQAGEELTYVFTALCQERQEWMQSLVILLSNNENTLTKHNYKALQG